MKKRHPFTLIEMIISMMLMMVLLTTLTYFFRHISSINTEWDKIQDKQFEMSYVENRLLATLTKAIWSNKNSAKQYFFTPDDPDGLFRPGTKNLLFLYNRGVDLDEQFSDHVLGRLFVNHSDQLILATWPEPKLLEKMDTAPPIKIEVLLENVTNLQFSFFSVPKNIDETPQMKNKGWDHKWEREYQQLPAMIRIFVTQDNLQHTFAFSLPAAKSIIHYEA